MTCDTTEHCREEPRARLDNNVQPECDFFDEPFVENQPTVATVNKVKEPVACQLIRPKKQLVPDPMVELGNAHWQEQNPTTTYARAMLYDELTPQDIAFFNSRTKKLNFLDEHITEDPNAAFPKPPVEWRNVQPAYRPGFVQPPQMQFLPPPPPFHAMHLGPPPPPPPMQNGPYGMHPWQTPEQAAYMHTFNLQRLKLVREQREAFSRSKKTPKKGGKKPKKPILRRRNPEIQRQTPSRELLAAPIQKRISAVTASAVSQGAGFSGFCGVLKVNPLYPDCRGRVSTIKEVDGITYFECANCGTRRRFLEEDEEIRNRR